MLYTLVGFIASVVMIVIVNSVFNMIDFISRCETRKDYAREWHRLSRARPRLPALSLRPHWASF